MAGNVNPLTQNEGNKMQRNSKLTLLLALVLAVFIAGTVAAQDPTTQPPGFVVAGNAFKTGDHSAFAIKSGFHALESVRTDSTGKVTGSI